MSSLEWRGTEAYWRGRLVFSVTKERSGWKLYRYSQLSSGAVVFKSKESVRNLAAGRAYAEGLARLWPEPKCQNVAPNPS